MANEKNVSIQVGPGFCGTLAIVLIVLKLTNYIDWSWIWVLCPLWIGLAFFVVFFLITLLVLVVVEMFKK